MQVNCCKQLVDSLFLLHCLCSNINYSTRKMATGTPALLGLSDFILILCEMSVRQDSVHCLSMLCTQQLCSWAMSKYSLIHLCFTNLLPVDSFQVHFVMHSSST